MTKAVSVVAWSIVALAGAGAMAWLALSRGETINAAWLLTAAVCCYLVGYRFYSKLIAAKVFALDANRAKLISGASPGVVSVMTCVSTPRSFSTCSR